ERDLLRPAARGGLPDVGAANATGVRFLPEALSEIHASEDVRRPPGEKRPADMIDERELIAELARPNAAAIDEFRRGIDPLASTGKLGALLAQFPPSFKSHPMAIDYLSDLLRAFAGYPVAVELRHRSWSDRMGETLALLNGFGAALAQI